MNRCERFIHFRCAGQLALAVVLLMFVGCVFTEPPEQISSKSIILADNGQALIPIVISPGASSALKETARELKLYLDQITGASFRIEEGDGASGIVLGTLNQFPAKDLQKDLEIRDGYDGKESYAIQSSTNRLLLLGDMDLGASHATFRLLEHLGCRWFFPAKEWEIIPKIVRLEVDLSENDRPVLLSRQIWYAYGFFDEREKQDYLAWARHNRMAESLKVRGRHTYGYIIADNKLVFKSHPEYLALKKDGQRDWDNLCLSQPAVRQLAVQYALDWLKKHPADDMAPMDPSDAAGLCECDQCHRAFKSISDAAFGLANEVAVEVAKQYPGKMVGLLAYSSHAQPPDFAMEPNVHVTLTVGAFTSPFTFEELIKHWREKCKNFSSGREYYSVCIDECGNSGGTTDLPPGGRPANLMYLQQSIRSYAASGSKTLSAESGDNWGIHGIGYYIANRLMWNPQVNVSALLDDFYEKAFGVAAPVMKRYYERFDTSREPLISDDFFALAFRDLEEASRMAKNLPEIQGRLNHLKIYLRYASLGWRLRHEEEKSVQRRELGKQIYTIAYRQRHSGMVHWMRLREQVAGLPYFLPEDRSWMTNMPGEFYSFEEIAIEFKESLSQFQPDPVAEMAFSRKLVPVVLGESLPVVVRQNYYSGSRFSLTYPTESPVYAFHVSGGKPLEIGFKAWLWADNPGPNVTYRVTDGDGQLIQSGQMPVMKRAAPLQSLQIKVPRPGIYFIKCDQEGGANITVVFPDTTPIALELYRGHAFRYTGALPEMYFYVPKGTRQIDYYWDGDIKQPHTIKGPHGEVIQQVRSTGRLIHMPVPVGTDGQVWSLVDLKLGQLWFFNIPNYLFPSPKSLLLPADLVEKDNLPVQDGVMLPPLTSRLVQNHLGSGHPAK